MPIVENEFSLDIVPGYLPPTINVSEYDIGRSYTITLLNDGESFEIPSGAAAIIEGTLEDYVYHSTRVVKAVFRENATVSNNKVKFTLTEAMTPYKGQVWCKIKLTLGEDTISSCGFIMAVDRAGAEAEVVINARGFGKQIKDAVTEYLDEEGFESNYVSYNSVQNLSAEQKYRARKNIDAYGSNIDTMPIRLIAAQQYLGKDGGYVNFLRGPYPKMLSKNFENFDMPIPEIATRIRQGSLALLFVNKDTGLLYDICSSGTGDIDSVVFYPTSVSGANGPTGEWYADLEGQLLFYEDDSTLSIRFECHDPRIYKNIAIVQYKEYTYTPNQSSSSVTETFAVVEFSHEDLEAVEMYDYIVESTWWDEAKDGDQAHFYAALAAAAKRSRDPRLPAITEGTNGYVVKVYNGNYHLLPDATGGGSGGAVNSVNGQTPDETGDVKLTIPSKTSQLTNDSKYVKENEVLSIVDTESAKREARVAALNENEKVVSLSTRADLRSLISGNQWKQYKTDGGYKEGAVFYNPERVTIGGSSADVIRLDKGYFIGVYRGNLFPSPEGLIDYVFLSYPDLEPIYAYDPENGVFYSAGSLADETVEAAQADAEEFLTWLDNNSDPDYTPVIRDVADPVLDSDVATKGYVDDRTVRKERDSQIVTPSGNIPTTETVIYTHTVTNAGHYLITANACGQYTSTTVDRVLTLSIKVNNTVKAQTISTSASSWYAEGALSINEELAKNDVVTITVLASKDSLAVKGVWHAGLCQLV